MGSVKVKANIQNVVDVYEASQGALPVEKVRSVSVEDALIDTGATMLSLPKRMIDQLGLMQVRVGTDRTPAGPANFRVFGPVRLTIQDRMTNCDVVELPDDCSALIGQIPLEGLDFIVDPIKQKLVGNPEHGGEQMIDLLSYW